MFIFQNDKNHIQKKQTNTKTVGVPFFHASIVEYTVCQLLLN